MNLSKQENLIEFCPNEIITRLDDKNYSLLKNNDTKYEYNTSCDLILKQEFSGTLSIDMNENLNVDRLNKVLRIDESKIPDKYDIKVSKLIPCKWHKKKRINKKMRKKHGHPNYIHRFETVKGCKLHTHTNGEFEFVRDGDKL